MAYCGPSCAIPSCASTPQVGFGSAGIGCGGLGSVLGSGYGYGGSLVGGYGGGLLGGAFGGSTSSGELGTLAGVIPQPINQVPPSEVVIQPSPTVLTIPGAILSASCEPITVGGNTPCATIGSGFLGRGLGRGCLGRKSLGICGGPCY